MAVGGASRGDDRPRARLLKRDGDLSALASVADAAGGGNGRFVVIEGRAGVGKTSLLTEARQIAAETGLQVLGARCSELEQDFAFGVVRRLFEPLLTAGAGEAAAPLFTGAAGLAAPLFDPSAIAAAEQSGDTSFAILHGLYWLAANAALSTRRHCCSMTFIGAIDHRRAGCCTSCLGWTVCRCCSRSRPDRRCRPGRVRC